MLCAWSVTLAGFPSGPLAWDTRQAWSRGVFLAPSSGDFTVSSTLCSPCFPELETTGLSFEVSRDWWEKLPFVPRLQTSTEG